MDLHPRKEEELEISAKLNHQTHTTNSLEKLQTANDNLDNIYQKAMEVYLESKTKDIKKLYTERRHAYAWETLHDVTDKINTPIFCITGGNTEEVEKLVQPF